MQRWRQWFRVLAVAAMFAAGVVAVSVLMPAARIFLAGRRATQWNDAIVVTWNRAVCRILNLRLHIHGRPDPLAGLIVANHISWLDIIAIGAQGPCLFIAKREVADWPVLGYLAKRIGTLFVQRGDAAQSAVVAERMVWRLRQGKRLVLFPEGTTSTGNRVLTFQSKLFRPAQQAGTHVQALALRYEGEAARYAPFVGEDAFLPHLLGILKLDRIDLHLCYCPAILPGMGPNTLARITRRQIMTVLGTGAPSRCVGLNRS